MKLSFAINAHFCMSVAVREWRFFTCNQTNAATNYTYHKIPIKVQAWLLLGTQLNINCYTGQLLSRPSLIYDIKDANRNSIKFCLQLSQNQTRSMRGERITTFRDLKRTLASSFSGSFPASHARIIRGLAGELICSRIYFVLV